MLHLGVFFTRQTKTEKTYFRETTMGQKSFWLHILIQLLTKIVEYASSIHYSFLLLRKSFAPRGRGSFLIFWVVAKQLFIFQKMFAFHLTAPPCGCAPLIPPCGRVFGRCPPPVVVVSPILPPPRGWSFLVFLGVAKQSFIFQKMFAFHLTTPPAVVHP